MQYNRLIRLPQVMKEIQVDIKRSRTKDRDDLRQDLMAMQREMMRGAGGRLLEEFEGVRFDIEAKTEQLLDIVKALKVGGAGS